MRRKMTNSWENDAETTEADSRRCKVVDISSRLYNSADVQKDTN